MRKNKRSAKAGLAATTPRGTTSSTTSTTTTATSSSTTEHGSRASGDTGAEKSGGGSGEKHITLTGGEIVVTPLPPDKTPTPEGDDPPKRFPDRIDVMSA